LNFVPLPIAAMTAVAVLGAMPLTLAILWQASDGLKTVSISLSKNEFVVQDHLKYHRFPQLFCALGNSVHSQPSQGLRKFPGVLLSPWHLSLSPIK